MIWAVKIDNLRGLLDDRRMYRIPNTWIRELCGMVYGVDERINKSVLHQFGPIERTGCMQSLSRSTAEEVDYFMILKKRGLTIGQARRIVFDRSEFRWGDATPDLDEMPQLWVATPI